jgi:hypothetical protein
MQLITKFVQVIHLVHYYLLYSTFKLFFIDIESLGSSFSYGIEYKTTFQ